MCCVPVYSVVSETEAEEMVAVFDAALAAALAAPARAAARTS
jgi:hypothetical protein